MIGCDGVTLWLNNVASFLDFMWDSELLLDELPVGFYAILDKNIKLELNDINYKGKQTCTLMIVAQ